MSETTDQADRANREIAVLDYRASIDDAKDRLRYQTEFAHSALKTLILVNGGAIVALLSFIGNASPRVDASWLWIAVSAYIAGLSLTIFAHVGAYFSQSAFMYSSTFEAWNAQRRAHGNENIYDPTPHMRKGNTFLYSGIAFAILGLIGFIVGSFFAVLALTSTI